MSNRPRARKPAPQPARRTFPVVPFVVGAAILMFALGAVVITQLGGDDNGNGAESLRQVGEVDVSGQPLPELPDSGADPAVGAVAPTVRGTTFDGAPVAIEPGSPTLVLFAVHWCPHCQAEIPRLAGPFRTLPAGTKVVTVSTDVNANRPNYPPSGWFERENWPTPVLADDSDSRTLRAYGVTGYPFFVFLDKDGKVVERASGGRPVEQVMAKLRDMATAA